MSRTLIVSDDVYQRLETTARRRGFQSVEQFLTEWQSDDDNQTRQATVDRINALQERLFAEYGEMSDSTALLREDRDR
jgi:chemotaxis methyl-accepting protein methylase